MLHFFAQDGRGRPLMLVNLGVELYLNPASLRLLAPPEGRRWALLWTSEDPRHGGGDTPPFDTEANWRVPGRAALVLAGTKAEEVQRG